MNTKKNMKRIKENKQKWKGIKQRYMEKKEQEERERKEKEEHERVQKERMARLAVSLSGTISAGTLDTVPTKACFARESM